MLSIMGLLTTKLSTPEGACSSRLQMPCLKCYTTVEMGVEFNTGYFSMVSAVFSLLIYLPFVSRVHENCRVQSFWCIPEEKEPLGIALLNLFWTLHHLAHATCHQLPNVWGSFSSWAHEQASQEYSTITEKLKSSDVFWVSFSTLITLEQLLFYCVPWRFHLNHICEAGILSVSCICKSMIRACMAAKMVTGILTKVQRHQRALHVQFDLEFEVYVRCSSTNISGQFSQTFDLTLLKTECFLSLSNAFPVKEAISL